MIAVLILSGLVVAGLVLGVFATANAPMGYQDDGGFHYGPEHAGSEEQHAPAQAPEPRLA